ncbi:MAG TPA: hypothetical protein PLJ38_00030 [bacterium]|nr:hypothetical protein [bacterium]
MNKKFIWLLIVFASLFLRAAVAPAENQNYDYGFIYEKTDNYEKILNPLTEKYIENSEIRLPLYRSEKYANSKILELAYPLFSYIDNEYKEDYQLLWLFKYTNYKGHQDQNHIDKDWFIFPNILKGKDTKEGDYFAVLPLFGNIRGRLGKDEIKFIMLPIYMKTRYKQTEINHYLYPIFAYSNNNPNYHYFKLFPFYANERRIDYQERSILWPFYKSSELQTKNKQNEIVSLKSQYIFPLYAVERRPDAEYKSYLYPILKYKVNAPNEYFSFFPLYERIHSNNYSKNSILFFVYNHTKKNNKTNLDLIYPLIKKTNDPSENKSELYILPIYKYRKSNDELIHQFFPIYKYSHTAQNVKQLNVLGLDLFLKDTSIEKNYARYWRILNYYRQNNDFDINFLFNILRYKKEENKIKFSIFPVLSIEKTDTYLEERQIKLFCGLIKFKI